MNARRICRFAVPLLAVACTVVGSRTQVAAQGVRRMYIGGAATAYSADVLAQSQYLVAQGDFLVSAATARKLNAEAFEHEMKNAVTWVHTYFERRRLNREYRAQENPGYLEKEEARSKQYRRLVRSNPQTVLDGDVTDELNWMVRDLLANTSYSLFMSDHPESLIKSANNATLSLVEKHDVRLSEGRNAGGKAMVFRADTAKMLETSWPVALREQAFDAARSGFEAERDSALAELGRGKQLDRDQEKRLMQAVDALSDALVAAYPRDRLFDSSAFLQYKAAQRYLQSLALSTYRLIETQNRTAFDDSLRFRGNSVAELLQHMTSKGLEFAKPEPGGEGTYRKLFDVVRSLYMEAVPERDTAKK